MLADNTWPAELDWSYMNYAIGHVAPILSPMLKQIEDLAAALEVQGKVEQDRIEHHLGVGNIDDVA